MRVLTNTEAFQVLLLQAADEGRGPVLFGQSQARASKAVPPFLVSKGFPDVYLEHPLSGEPFLDVTVLYNNLEPGTRVASPAAGEHSTMMDWFAQARRGFDNISCGFELDTNKEELPTAAVHFQPRSHVELVGPFFEAIGESQRADLYLDLAKRMPNGWPLSFFGLFRGRPNSPLRVCGYLSAAERAACADKPAHLADVFDRIGFSAYDDAMLNQVAAIMASGKRSYDFQFDIYPDGSLGTTFAIDVQFGIEQPEAVRQAFEVGPGAHVMGLLQDWGAADKRWKLGAQAAFARAIPVDLPDGKLGRFAFTLMPQWAKARWTQGVLQPAKLYHLAHAKLLDGCSDEKRSNG